MLAAPAFQTESAAKVACKSHQQQQLSDERMASFHVEGRLGEWLRQRHLGRGAHGEVALWQNLRTLQLIAVKTFIPHSDPQNPDYHEKKFEEEIEFMKKAENPHIVSTVDAPPEFGSSSTSTSTSFQQRPLAVPSLFMEYCSGGTLRSFLRRPENINGLPEKQVRAVLADISDAISYLHSIRIIHRDIKPENILIQQLAENNVYKLGDLGLAKDISIGESFADTMVGTMAYLAPEIQTMYFEGAARERKGKYGKSADYWSFGVIAFEICCGTLPFLPEESDYRRFIAVKNKLDEVIAITACRKFEGDYDCHKTFPYVTRLSPLLQQCIVLWLPSMLRWDGNKRGKYPVQNDADALTRLRRILQARCVEIQTITASLNYSVSSKKTVGQVQEEIRSDTGIPTQNQHLFTRDGVLLKPDDLALDFLKVCPLFLLDNSSRDTISVEIKISSVLAEFIKDPSKGKGKEFQIWKLAIRDVQAMLEKSSRLVKYTEGLRKATISLVQPSATEFSNKVFYLERLLELESRLNVDHLLPVPLIDSILPLEAISQARDAIKADMKEYPTISDIPLTFNPLNTHQLEERYSKLLEQYQKWKNARKGDTGLDMTSLAKLIADSSLAQGSILQILSANNKMLLEHWVTFDNGKYSQHQKQLDELDKLIHPLEHRQVLKEQKLRELCDSKPGWTPSSLTLPAVITFFLFLHLFFRTYYSCGN